MPKKVYRTAIYCRLSREDGDKIESNSIASQRAICEDYIAKHDDLELVCEPFIDDGYSGVSFNRPQFKKLEEAIRKGALDCIVVKDLSRFSRNYIDGGRYLEKIFPQLGIRFIAVTDAYDSLTGDPQSDSFVIPFKKQLFIYLTKIIPDYQEKATFYFNSSKNTLPQSVKYTLYKTPIAINNRKQASNVIPPAPSPGKTKQKATRSRSNFQKKFHQ